VGARRAGVARRPSDGGFGTAIGVDGLQIEQVLRLGIPWTHLSPAIAAQPYVLLTPPFEGAE
jgi:hypothetical protein